MLMLDRAMPPLPAPGICALNANPGDTLLDHIDCGVIVCDHRSRLMQVNRAGRRELAAGSALKVQGNVVRSAGEGQDDLAAAILDAIAQERSRLLRLGRGCASLMVVVKPVRTGPLNLTAAALVLGRRTPCSALGLEMLAGLYRLTLAEQRVLRALLASRSPRQIAAGHGVGIATVRTQIQALRDKLAVRNIDELLLLVAQMPAVTTSLDFGMLG